MLATLLSASSTGWAAETQITVWNKLAGEGITAEINGGSLGPISPGLFYRSTQPAVSSDVQGTVTYDIRAASSNKGCRATLYVNVTRGVTVGCSIEPAVSLGDATCTARHWFYITVPACAAELTIDD